MKRILVTGANGQIGSELVPLLSRRMGSEKVIASDLQPGRIHGGNGSAIYERLDVTDAGALRLIVEKYDVGMIYHLASLLSAKGEKQPDLAWTVNIDGLKHVLDLAREMGLRVFWPSSIAVFGPDTRALGSHGVAPQVSVLDPRTVYGVTKVSGELLCRYCHDRFAVDVRSIRYPGLISYTTPPGGGTTDFAVEMFYAAARGETYTCFVKPETRLPMMYMPDALAAAVRLMDVEPGSVSVRTSYNVGALSFSAEELQREITRHVPSFTCRYQPDDRQTIADSWPQDVDDSTAREDWDWKPEYGLERMVQHMLEHLSESSSVRASTAR